MTDRIYWMLAALCGLVLTAFGLYMIDKFPAVGHDISDGFGGPVFAFEMAKNPADLIAVFGPAGDPERAARLAQMDEGNYWDFPFMALYAGFMALFMTAARKTADSAILKSLTFIALLSGVADAVENMILLEATANIDSTPQIGLLFIPVWIKFFSIMLCLIGAGIYIIGQKAMIWRVLGVLSVLGGLTILIAFISPSDYGFLIRHGVTLGWIIMLVFAIYKSVQKRPVEVDVKT